MGTGLLKLAVSLHLHLLERATKDNQLSSVEVEEKGAAFFRGHIGGNNSDAD